MTCTTSGANSTSFASGENVLADADKVDLKVVAAGGTAKRVSLFVAYSAKQIHQFAYVVGADNGEALADTADQASIFYNALPGGITISSVWCESDGGTPSINLQKDDGSPANILSSNLSCSTSGASTTTFDSGRNAIATTDKVDFVMVSAGGTAKRVMLFVKYTVD